MQTIVDEHEARLEAQGNVEWMSERQRRERLDDLVESLSTDVRHLRDELSSVQRTVKSLLEHHADLARNDLEAKTAGPCPGAQALVEFHQTDGYRALAEAFND
jgi:phage tail tape-measure protein